MVVMVPRVPDEYFRKRAGESGDVQGVGDPPASEGARPETPVVLQPLRDGVAPRFLVLILVLAAALSFLAGRLLIFKPAAPEPPPSASVSAGTLVPADNFVPFDGQVVAAPATGAYGMCALPSGRNGAVGLIDDDPGTIWRCEGDGVGDTITFTFEQGTTLVGIRLVNGNTVWPDSYTAERRLVSVQWRFEDGSFLVQGLAANKAEPQEVRFPAVITGSVTMTVLASTVPGSSGTDAISISSLEFLAPT